MGTPRNDERRSRFGGPSPRNGNFLFIIIKSMMIGIAALLILGIIIGVTVYAGVQDEKRNKK